MSLFLPFLPLNSPIAQDLGIVDLAWLDRQTRQSGYSSDDEGQLDGGTFPGAVGPAAPLGFLGPGMPQNSRGGGLKCRTSSRLSCWSKNGTSRAAPNSPRCWRRPSSLRPRIHPGRITRGSFLRLRFRLQESAFHIVAHSTNRVRCSDGDRV